MKNKLFVVFFTLVTLIVAQVNVAFAENKQNYSKATQNLITFFKQKSDNQTEIQVIKEIDIPESDFFYVLLKFTTAQTSKELSFITNGKYITNSLIDLKTGNNLAQYYESKAKTIEVETSEDEVYFGNPEKAKVKIVIFSDFECPYCNKLSNALGSFFKEHENDIVIYYKHFPLSFHQNAKLLAKIYETGKILGYNWNMYQYDYSNKSYNEITALFEKKLKDEEKIKFYKLLNSPEIERKIEKHLKQAESLGIKGVPFVIINGYAVNGFQEEVIKSLIKEELES